MVPRPEASIANTLRTSDWDMPNCRAIRDDLMPALNAARTAFTCPRVNETVAASTCRLWEDLSVRDERLVVCSVGGNLPRRPISSRVAAWSKSNSPSLKCLTALRRFFGSTCRCEDASAVGCVAGMELVGDGEPSRTVSVENRSGVGCSPRSRTMAGDHAPINVSKQLRAWSSLDDAWSWPCQTPLL